VPEAAYLFRTKTEGSMNSQAYIREIPGAKTAVLMIHGIVGTPEHFAMLYPYVPEDWSIYSIRLAGHGGSVEDFAAASMRSGSSRPRSGSPGCASGMKRS